MEVFRKMTEADVDAVAELEKEIFSDAWTSKSIYETFCQQQAFIAVAEENGEIAGYCIVYYVMDEGEIARIAVNPQKQRRGFGRHLLDYSSFLCREKGVARLLLDVRESNETAKRFYENYGFTEDGVRRNFYQMPTENAVLMSKNIG